MPTILELFENKTLSGGQTAQKQYDIRNSKDSNIRTNSAALNVALAPVNLVRKNLSARLKETRLEEEVTGVRIMRTFASPIIYGTALPKIIMKQSSSTITMKNGSNLQFEGGIITNLIEKAKDKLKDFASSKLGIKFPELLIPTRVKDKITAELRGSKNGGPISKDKLIKIRDAGQGNLLGNILSKPLTPQQIGNTLAGAGINAAKKAAKEAIFGLGDKFKQVAGGATGERTISIRRLDNPYGSKNKYSKIIKIRNGESVKETGNLTSLTSLQDEFGKPVRLGGGLIGLLATLTTPNSLFVLSRNSNTTLNYANIDSKIFPEFPEFSVKTITQNIPQKRDLTKRYSKDSAGGTINTFRIDNTNKTKFNTKKDLINLSTPVYLKTADTEKKLANNNLIEDYDFVTLRFYSLAKSSAVYFKATISGLNESFSPSWEGSKFIGNPFNFYTYGGVERSVSFNFKVYSLNSEEHKAAWQKLNFLAGLVYPQNSYTQTFITPPFIQFTLGNMYKNKGAFIDSLSFEVDDNTPWETGLYPTKNLNRITKLSDTNAIKNFKLPTIINVNITIKFVETSFLTNGKNLYAFGNGSVGDTNLNDDSSAKVTQENKIPNKFVEAFNKL